jgi:hypothetical protein
VLFRAVWGDMVLETNPAVRGTPSMKCQRVLICTLLIAHAFLQAYFHAAALETAGYPRRTTRQLAQETEQPAGMQTGLGQHPFQNK